MYVSSLRARQFRHFSDLTISIPGTPKLVVLCGPNGVGKSSVSDAFRIWQGQRTWGFTGTPAFWDKYSSEGKPTPLEGVSIGFHDHSDLGSQTDAVRKAFYIRNAHRNDPEFTTSSVSGATSPLEDAQANAKRSIDSDVRVSKNYEALVGLTVGDLYGGDHDDDNVGDLRESYTAELRAAMHALFPDLTYIGPGNPFSGGTFQFSKGSSESVPYMNISGGEKAAFDLLLDMVAKRPVYDDTVFFIDEPEAHLNSRVQGALLRELVRLVAGPCQLWIATHSIGMLHAARDMQQEEPGSVAFLNFEGHDSDQPVVLEPVAVDRSFWKRTLRVALGDIADLVAPSTVVICEGKSIPPGSKRADFDARCYRTIFGNVRPDTEFVSGGNSLDVEADRLALSAAFGRAMPNANVIRLVDRDDLGQTEVDDLNNAGVRVLGLRSIESYLLDDSVLAAYCDSRGQSDLTAAVLAAKQAKVESMVREQGKPANDLKSARGLIFTEVRRILQLQGVANTADAFLRDELSAVLRPGMQVWEDLHLSVFGSTNRQNTPVTGAPPSQAASK